MECYVFLRSMCCCRHISLSLNWRASLSWLTWSMWHRWVFGETMFCKILLCSKRTFFFLNHRFNIIFDPTECWQADEGHLWDCFEQRLGPTYRQDYEPLQDDRQKDVSCHDADIAKHKCIVCLAVWCLFYWHFSIKVAVNVSLASVPQASRGGHQKDWKEKLPLWASLWPEPQWNWWIVANTLILKHCLYNEMPFYIIFSWSEILNRFRWVDSHAEDGENHS